MARSRRRWLTALAVVAILAGLALGAWWWLRIPPRDASLPEARAIATRVLNGETALRGRALSSLAGAVERDPDDPEAHLWLGLTSFHALVDTGELRYAIHTERHLERAAALDPGDGSTEGWRAFFAYQKARSRGEDLAAPRAALLEAGRRDPGFTSFLVAVALAPMPLESGYPQRVLPPLEAIEDCGDGTSHTCRTGPLFPHGAEGYHATVGDLHVRLGDVEAGRASYARALAVPSAPDWPYREAFLRWVDGAEERARRSTDDDPADDPPVFFATDERACAACHRR